MSIWIFAFLLAIAGVGAIVRGGAVERRGVTLLAGGWLLSLGAQALWPHAGLGLALGLIDTAIIAGLIGLAWKSPRPWPAAACGFQALAIAAGVAKSVDPGLDDALYLTLLALAGYGAVITLIVGAWAQTSAPQK